MSDIEDYRAILSARLESRMRQNPRYSLRAFARNLNVSPSRLSRVLRGRQGLGKETAEEISNKLFSTQVEKKLFETLVLASDARSKKARADFQKELENLNNTAGTFINEELFQTISSWYHVAILELTDLPEFRSDTKWISKRICISNHQASSALRRLIKVGLLIQGPNGLVKAQKKL